MCRYYTRAQLQETKRERYSTPKLATMTLVYTAPCIYCGEGDYVCVFQRRNFKFICENCYRKNAVKSLSRARAWIWALKAMRGCYLCDEDDPACLEFHHIHKKKKKFTIGDTSSHIPTDVILREIEKCVVICCNCHKKVEVNQ